MTTLLETRTHDLTLEFSLSATVPRDISQHSNLNIYKNTSQKTSKKNPSQNTNLLPTINYYMYDITYFAFPASKKSPSPTPRFEPPASPAMFFDLPLCQPTENESYNLNILEVSHQKDPDASKQLTRKIPDK